MQRQRVRTTSSRSLPGLLGLGLSLGLGLLSACGYTSQYQAPSDGRARVVWGKDDDPVIELSGSLPDATCATALQQITGHSVMPTTAGNIDLPAAAPTGYSMARSEGYWAPRYYGPQIIVVQPGFAPLLPRPPLFSPSLAITEAILRSRGPSGGIGSIGHPGAVRVGGGGGGPSIGRGGGGGGSGRLDGAALALLAVAIMVIPAIDIGLAAARPESSRQSARAIDLVNAYNDLMRSPGAPCSTFSPPLDAPPADAPGGAP